MKSENKAVKLLSKKPAISFAVVVVILSVGLVFSVVFAVNLGSADISAGEIARVIACKLFGIGDPKLYDTGPVADIVWYVRLPRTVLAIAVGAGLSVCGVVMQAIVKNPLADPYILGISSGASLGATAAMMFSLGALFGKNFVGVCAFIGAFAVSLAVMSLANIGGRANSVKLLLAGMAVSAICSAFSNFTIYFSNDKDSIQNIAYWLMGSLAGADWDSIVIMLPFIVLGTLFFWTQSRTLNLMLLGDETAITLGMDLHKHRHLFLLICSAMIGFVVYATGMIGFVGLVVPHAVRMVFGTNHKTLVPLSALVGAIFLVWADVLCRVIIKGTEIPIGILTSMIGAPCFIYLMVRKKYGFGGGE